MKTETKMQRCKGAKKSIPKVVNMSCKGGVQCPICYALFGPTEGKTYTAGITNCPWCNKRIEIDWATADYGNAIISGRDVNVIRRVQWHLDVPVCRILSGIRAHVAALSMKERFWLYYHLGCETTEELVLIMRELIRLRRKHKRPLKTV